ncbi:N-6 DNA methylase [Planctomyces sp. SH-PL62]|uniref:N-6 DNA methylase n=1 Tax=Planctomyces sp. SH-PL62 TaxID=1636152 RepID=UPI00078EEE31|nr:N-6 DNA methylase [Planctomyces sp. SH-PL62]AMV40459.1 N-6 DNA Methylase [Planctomyces sp. SH-PL62]
MTVVELLAQIARRDNTRSEATLQADIRQLVLTAPLSLRAEDVVTADLETPVGLRRRIDIEVGSCLIEVKRDLSAGNVLPDAISQIAGYLAARQIETGCRYVGILTDGADWRCVCLPGEAEAGPPREVSAYKLSATKPDPEPFLIWLEGVLATARDIPATPREIRRRLGAGSSAHDLDRDTLLALFTRHRDHPAVLMKRQLWARLLTTALGTQFEDSDDLFVEHTYLVNTAEIIAHALVGFDLESIAPASLLSGGKFEQSGITGVVEADFFDWVAHVPGGEPFVRSLARRVGRFRWQDVSGDVLKVLYESVITAPTRKRLGEYYTPDWLAERVVSATIERPLETRALDPSCGSGTFLFHAARRYLASAEAAGLPLPTALSGLTRHVLGMDLHPVAVTLARVTYLLAIGRDRLTHPERGPIQVPVYLGDAVQWKREAQDLFSGGNLVIETDDRKQLFESELRFPEEVLEDPGRFNQIVESMTKLAGGRKPGSSVPKLSALYQRYAVSLTAQKTLDETFQTLCDLHDEGRDHIWSYYVRNLARPWWLALPQNRVDALIGNPPWLAFRFMTEAMQKAFREYSDERGLWHGAKVATHQDLSGLFLVRAVERYLKIGGRFGFVMPNAAVDRGQFQGLRTGRYKLPNAQAPVSIAFDPAWDLRRIRPHFFPRGSAVLFGTRADQPRPLPTDVTIWSGRVSEQNANWDAVASSLMQASGKSRPSGDDPTSPWAERFRNGATIFPRFLFFVTRQAAGPLGMPAGKVAVRSLQRNNDKKPWKDLPALEGVVETEFIRPVLLGESVIPYRIAEAFEAVLPWDREGLMDGLSDRLDAYEGLANWWRRAEAIWEKHRSSDRLTLCGQLDYRHKFQHQFPLQPERIVYAGSGMHLVASRLSDRRAVIEHGLYWATAASTAEAQYLCAILNSASLTELVRPFMSYGKDERHFDKHIWQVPVPLYDPTVDLHARLSARGAELEAAVGALEIDPGRHFAAVRRDVRAFIAESEAGRDVEALVEELLS